MTLLGYNHTTKVFHYRDDADQSVWQTKPNHGYGELVPFQRHASDHALPGITQPQDALYFMDPHREKFGPKGAVTAALIREHGDPVKNSQLIGTMSCQTLYLIDPRCESFTLNGTRPNGMVWRLEPEEQGYVFLFWWPRHLVRQVRLGGELEQIIENWCELPVDYREGKARF